MAETTPPTPDQLVAQALSFQESERRQATSDLEDKSRTEFEKARTRLDTHYNNRVRFIEFIQSAHMQICEHLSPNVPDALQQDNYVHSLKSVWSAFLQCKHRFYHTSIPFSAASDPGQLELLAKSQMFNLAISYGLLSHPVPCEEQMTYANSEAEKIGLKKSTLESSRAMFKGRKLKALEKELGFVTMGRIYLEFSPSEFGTPLIEQAEIVSPTYVSLSHTRPLGNVFSQLFGLEQPTQSTAYRT